MMDSRIQQFMESLNGKSVTFCGVGVSNTPVAELFARKGAHVTICDKRSREQLGAMGDRLAAAGAQFRLGPDYLAHLDGDMVFRTPGMKYTLPELTDARRRGIAVTSEMEMFFELCPCPIIAVTGSDGKTTTTTVIAEMLKAQGKRVYLGGNIGAALLPLVEQIAPDDIAVVELSSFQLISMRRSPDVAVITNITPNHLDMHKDMDEYVNAKKNIFLHQNAFGRTVLNRDNALTHSFVDETRGQVLEFSRRGEVENGAWLRSDGTFAARKVECFSNQGAYASHGHSIVAKAMGSFAQHYPCDNMECDAWTVFTNRPAAGAMRGYGMPQASFADESNVDECAKAVGMDPLAFRMQNLMPKGFEDAFSHNVNYEDSFRQCLEVGRKYMDYDRKVAEYAKDTGPVRRGIGVATFWYNTAVYPISLETSSNRMQLNLDGTVNMQCGETEIGQGADTAYAQMTADVLGLKSYRDVHVISCQDTDVTPTGLGAYASRQTYVAGFSIRQTGLLLKEKILKYAADLTRQAEYNMDIVDGNIVRTTDGKVLMSLSELAMTAQYNPAKSEHITAESTYTIRNNAYSFGCTFAEVEVDIPMCKVTLKNIVNVHDCGRLINPALAEAQVHGGMSMAIGYGMSEQLLFDEKTGRPLNNNLLDYKISTFMDHPHLTAKFVENAEPTSAFGTKALGEPPACSGAPAIRNAIYNATGVAIDQNPINPHILFKRFSEEGLIQD